MNFDIGKKYHVTSDRDNYILQEKKKAKNKDAKNQEYATNIGYFGKIEHLLNYLLDIEFRNNEIETLGQLKTQVADLRGFVRESVKDLEEELKAYRISDGEVTEGEEEEEEEDI